jgi:hypothetical protein
LWRGDIFRVLLSTLLRDKQHGSWGLVNFTAKSRTLFLCRLLSQRMNGGTLTSDWLWSWKLHKPFLNPPHITGIPATLDHLWAFVLDAAYAPSLKPPVSRKAYRCRVYRTMQDILRTTTAAPMMRIERKWPQADWRVVWKNIHDAPVNEITKVMWYKAVHDILPTARLNHIPLASSALCEWCDQEDYVQHRLTVCNRGPHMWMWTCERIATIVRTDWRRIPTDWLLRPDFRL